MSDRPIVDLIGKLPMHPTKRYPERTISQLTRLVLHHAAGPETQTPQEIARAHVQQRGWPGVAYTYLISPAGVICKAWRMTTVTWCVAGGNTASLCVCLLGHRSILPCPPAQWDAAVWLFARIQRALPGMKIYGHREVPTSPPQATECPGRLVDMDAFRAAVAAAIGEEEEA